MKLIYNFNEEDVVLSKSLLGGKGYNLSQMMKLGLPIPNGFVITTKACSNYYENNKELSSELKELIINRINNLSEVSGKNFGKENPLLVSVRSGAKISMPGMMDTVLNLGLNDETVEYLAERTSNSRFAYDSYRRFIQMFSDVVLELDRHKFEGILSNLKESKGYSSDLDLTEQDLKELVVRFKGLVFELTNAEFPKNPVEQLLLAVEAVFKSWNNDRAIIYRKLNNIPDDIFTAVCVQEMVFGNKGLTSGTGVLFTRNPSNGDKGIYGEYLMNAQGEDVVAGIRTPQNISSLENDNKKVYDQLMNISLFLENHYKDMQDIEFTIEESKLYILQTRTGKRTAKAMVKIAVDMVKEGLITKNEALLRIEPSSLNQLLFPSFSASAIKNNKPITKGLGASTGAVSGKVYFDNNSLKSAKARNEKAILLREETSPEDIEGMIESVGIITATGGATSHAAVVARGMGKACIVGCKDIVINNDNHTFTIDGVVYPEGTLLSFDGSTGNIYLGELETIESSIDDDFKQVLTWADEAKRIYIKANADNAADAKVAIDFGAVGIGLCRTEHMFFEEDRIPIVREMIISRDKESRLNALDKLFKFQKDDFKDLYRVTEERSVTIRLLDPPLHEFLPRKEEEMIPLAQNMGKSVEEIKQIIASMHEVNPMLGHRGCRLAITYPEIYLMQVRAIITAAIEVNKELNINIVPEIKIPLIAGMKEYMSIKQFIVLEIEKLKLELGHIDYKIGIMIEVPRAALLSNELASESDFLSYGTNDLTQLTLGFSRDDSQAFIDEYLNEKLFQVSPFTSIDQRGVGKLVEISQNFGKMTNPNIKTGVCGEHGGDPDSIEFFNRIGLDYVSCSPYRVPVAIVSAAIANLRQ